MYSSLSLTSYEDLDFADNINSLSLTHRDIPAKTNDLQAYAELVGLKINIEKIKTMGVNTQETPITLSGINIEEV